MYRQELKYLLHQGSAEVVRSRLKHICGRDGHGDQNGCYRVSSLYFDDYCDSCVFDNLGGFKERKKFRIRVYNGSDALIKLERKVKNNNLCQKDSVLLSREQYRDIMAGDYLFMREARQPLLRDFYLLARTRLLKPVLIVDYRREAYLYDPGRVRITLDQELRASLSGLDLLGGDLIYRPVLNSRQTIMEVKYSGFLPDHIRHMIQSGQGLRQAVSKYKYCRMATR